MARNWRKYETLILFDAGLGMEAVEGMLERFRAVIKDKGGKMLKTERWGLRDMAFLLKRQSKAYYVLLEYAGASHVSIDLEHQLNLIDSIIKFQTVKTAAAITPESVADVQEAIVEKVISKTVEVLDDDDEDEVEEDEEE